MLSTGREEDFRRTLASILEGSGHQAELQICTNGSTDGTGEIVKELGGFVDNADSRIWYGNTRLIEALKDNDLIVLSADDLEYRKGWLANLVNFIEAAPDDIALFSCYMEPVWEWNQPIERVEYGGQEALIRQSVCGSSWAFRSEDWFDWMGPFEEIMPGEDLKVCKKTAAQGKRMAALDLAEHIGVERSAWGNQSHLTAQPLDREEWGLAHSG
jgi:glycosyltransferase involved in cell wall biosynthesis